MSKRVPLCTILLLAACRTGPVQDPAPYGAEGAIESLAFSDGAIGIRRGERAVLTLLASVGGEQRDVSAQATFESGDVGIAAIEGGEVVAVAEGETTVWGEWFGVRSDAMRVSVSRGAWTASVVAGMTAQQGKLVDIVVAASGTTFDDGAELSVDGLVPFGEARADGRWWGPVAGQPDRWKGRFLVPPTAAVGPHEVRVSIGASEPDEAPTITVSEVEFTGVHDCDYFASEANSDWAFTEGPNSARTWQIGDLTANTATRYRAVSGGDATDPYLVLWDLAGQVLTTSDDDPAAPGEAAIEVVAEEDLLDGAYYLTATVSPSAAADEVAGQLLTDCDSVAMGDPVTASNAGTLFPSDILAGTGTEDASFDFSGLSGTVQRLWVKLDITLTQPQFTTFRLRSPQGTSVALVTPSWSEEFLDQDGDFVGAVGGPAPFRETGAEWVGGAGTTSFAGQAATGVWRVEVEMLTAGTGGEWRDARIWVER